MINRGTVQLLQQLRALDVRLRVQDGLLIVDVPKGRLTPALEAALRDKKQELLQALAEQSDNSTRSDLTRVSRATVPLRLSFFQERLWVLDQLQPGHTAYNLAVCSEVMSGVDVEILRTAISRTIDRHEILRSRYVSNEGVPNVRFAALAETRVSVRDLRLLTSGERLSALKRAAAEAARESFDLANEAPVRFTILQVSDNSAALLLAAHHHCVGRVVAGRFGHRG